MSDGKPTCCMRRAGDFRRSPAEVHRLYHSRTVSKAGIAWRVGMAATRSTGSSRCASHRGTCAPHPASQLDPFADRIVGQLATDPTVRATVVRERLPDRRIPRRDHDPGRTASPGSARRPSPPARIRRRRTGRGRSARSTGGTPAPRVPVCRGRTREAFGLVTTLPFSAAHAITFTSSVTTATCARRSSAVSSGSGRAREARLRHRRLGHRSFGTGSRARLHDEVAGRRASHEAGRAATGATDLEGQSGQPAGGRPSASDDWATRSSGSVGSSCSSSNEVSHIPCDPRPRPCFSP